MNSELELKICGLYVRWIHLTREILFYLSVYWWFLSRLFQNIAETVVCDVDCPSLTTRQKVLITLSQKPWNNRDSDTSKPYVVGNRISEYSTKYSMERLLRVIVLCFSSLFDVCVFLFISNLSCKNIHCKSCEIILLGYDIIQWCIWRT